MGSKHRHHHHHHRHMLNHKMLNHKHDSGAPGAAPAAAGAPGGAPAASPAAPKDNWGADTHAEEFGKEYVHHTREGLKEPHVGEKGWISETHANVANFDSHGSDFVTDSRSPVTFSGAVTHTVAVTTLLLFFLH